MNRVLVVATKWGSFATIYQFKLPKAVATECNW